jgi:hypothetical protein
MPDKGPWNRGSGLISELPVWKLLKLAETVNIVFMGFSIGIK